MKVETIKGKGETAYMVSHGGHVPSDRTVDRNADLFEWVMRVVESSQTVEQVFTGLKLMEQAGMTDTEEYKLWSEFEKLIK